MIAAIWIVPLGGCIALFIYVLARLIARTTVYAITNRRVVFKIGVALPAVVNIPLANIASGDLLVRKDGSSDIALELTGSERFAYLLLWPHARPWRIRQPAPAMRSIDRGSEAAEVLRRALLDATRQTSQALDAAPSAAAFASEPGQRGVPHPLEPVGVAS